MNPFKIPIYQLYLLQLENYELGRFWKLLFKKGLWPRGEQRKNLEWTQKAKALFLMALGLHILFGVVLIIASQKIWLWVILWIVAILFYFVFFSLALIILWPLDFFLKRIIISQAKSKVRMLSKVDSRSKSGMTQGGLKIIGIAGSYGKTTMKEALRQVLGIRFKVLSTPESVNTPVGIARFVLKNVKPETEILILELGEHYKGDIKKLCEIFPPDIAVITGINQAHMERMGDIKTVASTILEITKGLKPEGLLVLNIDDEYLFEHREKINFRKISFYGHKHPELTGFFFENVKFDTENLVWEFSLPSSHLDFKVHLLGEYVLGLAVAAQQVVGELRGNIDIVSEGLNKLQPVSHRLQPIKSSGDVLIIDDSYNGNPDGVREAIKILSRFTNRRKIFITPGLVELGDATAEVHHEIGKELAEVADVVILIKNSVTPWIEEGIKSANKQISQSANKLTSQSENQRIRKSENQIIWFDTATEAHRELKNILKPGDVILFQNDWGDQYV